MMRRDPRDFGVPATLLVVLGVAAILLAGFAWPAYAGNNPDAKVVIHVRPHNAKLGCKVSFDPPTATCADLVTTEPSFSFDAFPVFYELNEYLGCEYAVTWPNWTYSASFTNCADFVIGAVNLPGDMAAHTWTDCQSGMAVPSYLWIYADYAGMICPAEPTEPGADLKVLDCSEGVDAPIAVLCAGVYGAAGQDPCSNPPVCDVDPDNLDFGTIDANTTKDLSFVITNVGGETLEGTVSATCDHYSIPTGSGSFSLGADEFVEVVVRYEPTAAGTHECTVLTGTECLDVSCTGTAVEPPVCDIDRESIDFGTVPVGEPTDEDFTITNTGGGLLEGFVSEACPDFGLESGGGAYSLASGDKHVVTVRFTPSSPEFKECTIQTGQVLCANVYCSGTGEELPECDVDPTVIDLGTVTVDASKDTTFTITNTGGGTLTGAVSEICGDYEITGGGGAFSLGAAESRIVTVRFTPGSSGLKECTIETGQEICADVTLSGTGELPPDCQVTPTELDFGTVTAGETVSKAFTIENIGEGVLTGEVGESCDYYEIVSGAGAYSLGPAETREVTVGFTPMVSGTALCEVETGTDCENVSCTGEGEPIPVYVDIRPGKCPNKMRITLPLSIPVAALGTADFDVADIDPSTVKLTRQGEAGQVSPAGWDYGDLGTPFMGDPCDCHSLGPDGFQDVSFRFSI
jgi:hypothetical protein